MNPKHTQAASCTIVGQEDSVELTNTQSVPAGNYKVWIRMEASSDTASNDSVYLQLTDSAGHVQCFNMGDGGNIPSNEWKYVNYQNGDTNSIPTFSWSGMGQKIKLISRETGVRIDRVIVLGANDTCNPNESGKENDPTQGNNCIVDVPPLVIGTTAYRLYYPGTYDHIYTAKDSQRDYAKRIVGWKEDGVAFKVLQNGNTGAVPVYDLYNGRLTDHMYVIDGMDRYWALIYGGYADMGIAFYAYATEQPSTVPVYRLWSGARGDHFYTTSQAEKLYVSMFDGYKFDSVGFYVPQ